MATYQTQVEAYIGSYSDTAALSQFLTQGAKRVVDLIPPERAREFSTVVSIPEGGMDVSNSKVISVSGEGFPAREVGLESYGQFLDPDSLFYAVPRDPVFYITNAAIYVRPSSNNNVMQAISYPEVLFSDEDIMEGYHEFDELIVLYAAMQCRARQFETARTTLPVPPTSPDLTTEYNAMQSSLLNDEDIELAAGWANNIQANLARYAQALQLYGLEIQKAVQQIQFYQVSLTTLQSQYNAALQIKFGIGEKSSDSK